MTDAVKLIQRDHINMEKVLRVLLGTANNLTTEKSDEALAILNDALYYIQVFPERVHHPKEEKLLFPMVRKHRPDLKAVLNELEQQHAQGAQKIGELVEQLRQLEKNWSANRESFQALIESYVKSQREHIGLEEREILKPLQATIAASDWESLNSIYGVHNDPLFGENLDAGFDALLRRITKG